VSPEGRKVLIFFGTTLVVGTLAVVAAPRLLGWAAGPENDILMALVRTTREGMTVSVAGAGATLVSREVHFDRITVQVDPTSRTAEALSTLDFTGVLGDTQVSSLGVERTRFSYAEGWAPSAGWAPRLAAAVAALEARRVALEQADAAALARLTVGDAGLDDAGLRQVFALKDRQYRATAWYIRLDRDRGTVTEDYRLVGSLPDRPVDEEGRRSLQIERRNGEFFFSGGLM
jgi:hypothetical protein